MKVEFLARKLVRTMVTSVTLREFDKIAKPTNLLSNSLSQLIEHGKRTPKHLLDYFQLQVRLPHNSSYRELG